MEQYIRRFCEVKKPRDIVNFLESFVYVWPWALASLFGLYYIGANWLPRSFVVAGIGLALAEAARLHSSTISPYSTDYHLVEALKVVAMTIGTPKAGTTLPLPLFQHCTRHFIDIFVLFACIFRNCCGRSTLCHCLE